MDFYLIANAYKKALCFELPTDVSWRRIVDTSYAPPEDLIDEVKAPSIAENVYEAAPRSVVVLIAAQRTE